MDWILEPFAVGFVQRAFLAGVLVSVVCAIAGTWVVLRGMAFLGDAMSHGLLPGVALASLAGVDLVVGAVASAIVMTAGVTALGRSRRLSQDTAIGLLFVGMLATGVIIVSSSASFAVDLTGFLFGDVLAVGPRELWQLVIAALVTLVVGVGGHRAFVALAFDVRKAHTLGLRPGLAHGLLLVLVTIAIVSSFRVVGTLLVFALLIAPPAAAVLWARRIPVVVVSAVLLGVLANAIGLLVSWHAGTAAGATVAATAVALFALSSLAAAVRSRRRATPTAASPAEIVENRTP